MEKSESPIGEWAKDSEFQAIFDKFNEPDDIDDFEVVEHQENDDDEDDD